MPAQQLSLPGFGSPARVSLGADADTIALELSRRTDRRIGVTFTDNRTTMFSFRVAPQATHVRLHHLFHRADEEVLDALARLLRRRDRRAGRVIDAFIERHQTLIRPPDERVPQRRRVRARGRFHDLKDLCETLNARYFSARLRVRIGWAPRPAKQRRRTIRLGSYCYEHKTIRIHASLDRPYVPRYFVESIVYHEMLHALLDRRRRADGSYEHHSAEFRRLERRFAEHDRALRWERDNVHRLLRG